MAEYITKEQVLEWFRPYGHADEPIPFETLVADLRGCIPAADVAPVRHGRWIDKPTGRYGQAQSWCTSCGKRSGIGGIKTHRHKPYCPNCGAKMDGGPDVEAD